MSWIAKIVLGLVALPVLAIGFLYLNQRNMMYHPVTVAPDPSVTGAQDVQIVKAKTADGLDLTGWYVPPSQGQTQVFVYFQGNAGDFFERYEKIKPLIAQGYGALFVGYRGFSGNPGYPTEQGLYADATAFMKMLYADYNVRLYDMVLYGESLGSGVAIEMATQWDISGVILESPFTSTVDVAALTYGFLPLKWLMHDQYRNIDKVENVTVPILIMHGKKDDVVPFEQGQELFNAVLERSPSMVKKFVPFDDAAHVDVLHYGGQLQVEQFLRSIRKKKGR